MSINEPVKPFLSIKLIIDCPECAHHFDLIQDTDLNEEGWLLNQVLPETSWIDAHNNFKCSATCPECSVTFDVAGIEW